LGNGGEIQAGKVAEDWTRREFKGVKAKIGYASFAEDIAVTVQTAGPPAPRSQLWWSTRASPGSRNLPWRMITRAMQEELSDRQLAKIDRVWEYVDLNDDNLCRRIGIGAGLRWLAISVDGGEILQRQ